MNLDEFKKIMKYTKKETCLITIDSLLNKTDRTLLYGYTCERDTWHIYIKDGKIYSVIYKNDEIPKEIEIFSNMGYVPNKRLYPECCDYEFCELLNRYDIYMSYTTYNTDRPKQIYYGKCL